VTPDGKPAPNAKPKPYLRTQFNEWNGRFSPEPEPRSVAYESDESGRYDVYTFPKHAIRCQFQRAEAAIRNGVRMGANCSTCRQMGN